MYISSSLVADRMVFSRLLCCVSACEMPHTSLSHLLHPRGHHAPLHPVEQLVQTLFLKTVILLGYS